MARDGAVRRWCEKQLSHFGEGSRQERQQEQSSRRMKAASSQQMVGVVGLQVVIFLAPPTLPQVRVDAGLFSAGSSSAALPHLPGTFTPRDQERRLAADQQEGLHRK